MFDLIHNHQQQVFVPATTHNEPLPSQQSTGAWHEDAEQENNLNLIEVSDDEDDDLSDDSREVSDNDDSDFEDNSKKLSLEGAETIQMNSNDVKKIIVPLHNVQTEDLTENNPLEEVTDSLDELEDDEDEEDDEEEEEEDKEIFNNTDDSVKTFVMKVEEEEEEEEEKDYTKFKVTELRAMAAQKGLSNYKKLKKSPLIELIKASE